MSFHFLAVHASDSEAKPGSTSLSFLPYLRSELAYFDGTVPPAAALGPYCFPLGRRELHEAPETSAKPYTFTLLDGDGKQLHGFCLRVHQFHSDSGPVSASYPEVLCILAREAWFELFYRVLELMNSFISSADLLGRHDVEQLPATSDPATLLASLNVSLTSQTPDPGAVLRLSVPRCDPPCTPAPRTQIFTDPQSAAAISARDRTLAFGAAFADVQVPPPCMADAAPCIPTVALATLLYFLKPSILATLIASLLMERRIIIVSATLARLATAVRAAAVLLHPLKWHNMFLPLLPSNLLDCLASPTPYLVGLPAGLKGMVDWLALDDVVLVDLDVNTIEPAVGMPPSDSTLLPGWHQLVNAFAAMQEHVKDPGDYTANGTISAIVQEFLAVTIGRYHDYVIAADQPAPLTTGRMTQIKDTMRNLKTRLGRSGKDFDASGAGSTSLPRSESLASTGTGKDHKEDVVIEGSNGWSFHHTAFVSSFRGKQAQAFADALIHTQMWQVFVRERIDLMQSDYVAMDTFEVRVSRRKAGGLRGAMSGTLTALSNASNSANASGSSLAKWTGKSSAAMRKFGKQAAGAMKSAWAASNSALEMQLSGRSALSTHLDGGNPNMQKPRDFFQDLDAGGSQESTRAASHRRSATTVPTLWTSNDQDEPEGGSGPFAFGDVSGEHAGSPGAGVGGLRARYSVSTDTPDVLPDSPGAPEAPDLSASPFGTDRPMPSDASSAEMQAADLVALGTEGVTPFKGSSDQRSLGVTANELDLLGLHSDTEGKDPFPVPADKMAASATSNAEEFDPFK